MGKARRSQRSVIGGNARHPHSAEPQQQNVSDVLEQKVQKRRLTPQEVVTLVLDRYEGLKKPNGGKLTPFEDIVSKWKKSPGVALSKTTISRYISRAFTRGWVQVVPVAGNAPPLQSKRNGKLEHDLRKKFKPYGLQEAIVLDVGITPNANMADPDDPFYQALGQAMADRIASGFVRNGDSVGVGSGRGVYQTVKFLEKHEPLNIKGATLMSLTGSVWSRPDAEHRLAYWLDADFHVALFWKCCRLADPPVEPRYISHPLTSPALDQTWLGKWKDSHPTVALLGVGTLLKNHRFWVSSDTNKDLFDPILLPVFEDLKNLVGLFENDVLPDYSPVADTANHLFYVPHPDNAIRKEFEKKKKEAICKALAQINGKLLSVQDTQFPDIPSIGLIAGSVEKAFAIRELLVNPNYNVTLLCTDSAAAKKLLDYQESPEEVSKSS